MQSLLNSNLLSSQAKKTATNCQSFSFLFFFFLFFSFLKKTLQFFFKIRRLKDRNEGGHSQQRVRFSFTESCYLCSHRAGFEWVKGNQDSNISQCRSHMTYLYNKRFTFAKTWDWLKLCLEKKKWKPGCSGIN